MDRLEEQLRIDAEQIDVEVSGELDRRILASLHNAVPATQKTHSVTQRPAFFWWASSLTGLATAFVIIAVFNAFSATDEPVQPLAELPTVGDPRSMTRTQTFAPPIDWQAESAMLTQPLQQEMLDVQSDIRKVEQRVREDIGL